MSFRISSIAYATLFAAAASLAVVQTQAAEQRRGRSAEEIFHVPEYDSDGQPKKRLSVFEQYLKNQERKQKGKGKDEKANGGRSGTEDFFGAGSDADSWDDSGSWSDKKQGAADRD